MPRSCVVHTPAAADQPIGFAAVVKHGGLPGRVGALRHFEMPPDAIGALKGQGSRRDRRVTASADCDGD
jgi:hypothetical protein